jgi:hypothetical protein
MEARRLWSFPSGLNTRSRWRFKARMIPMRANIVGPPDVATRIKASIAACHSWASCSTLESRVMYLPASSSVTSWRPRGSGDWFVETTFPAAISHSCASPAASAHPRCRRRYFSSQPPVCREAGFCHEDLFMSDSAMPTGCAGGLAGPDVSRPVNVARRAARFPR